MHLRYNINMKQIDFEIHQHVRANISTQVHEQTRDMDKDEVVDLLVETIYKSVGEKEVSLYRKNALYAAKTEHIQLSLFDSDTLEPSDVEKDTIEFLKKKREACEITEQQCRETIAKVQAHRKKVNNQLANLKKLNTVKKNKPKKDCRNHEPDVVEVIQFDEDVHCPICGRTMSTLGYAEKTVIEYQPARYIIKKIKTEKKVCPAGCTDENGKAIILKAQPKEPDLIDKSIATPSLVAGLAYEKFMQGTPLYRLEKDATASGIDLSRQTMSNILQKCHEQYIAPVCGLINEDLAKQNVVHMDETPLQCLALKDRSTSYMACGVSGEYAQQQMVLYQFNESRKKEFITHMLGTDFTGALMTDGLQGYRSYQGCTKLSCLAHARRYFYDAVNCRDDYAQLKKVLNANKNTDDDLEKAQIFLKEHESLNRLIAVLNRIAELYQIENFFSDLPAELKAQARQELSKPLFEKLVLEVEIVADGFEEKTKAHKAATYFLERKEELAKYIESGIYPIDNNRAERKMKSFVIARKNFLFSNSVEGAESAAGYMTLLESAKMNRLKPFKYLEYVLNRMMYYKDKPIPRTVLEELVPYSKKLPEN
ncbi:transposase IS66, partial [gut metagenome]